MAQLFRPSSNTVAKVMIAGALLGAGSLLAIGYVMDRGPWMTTQLMAPEQPVPFSHKHHVKDDGIDCRYCHTSVETSAFAGLPPTETCMTCHSQIWTNASVLEPVRESWANGTSIRWRTSSTSITVFISTKGLAVRRAMGEWTRCRSPIASTTCTWTGASIVTGIQPDISGRALRFSTSPINIRRTRLN